MSPMSGGRGAKRAPATPRRVGRQAAGSGGAPSDEARDQAENDPGDDSHIPPLIAVRRARRRRSVASPPLGSAHVAHSATTSRPHPSQCSFSPTGKPQKGHSRLRTRRSGTLACEMALQGRRRRASRTMPTSASTRGPRATGIDVVGDVIAGHHESEIPPAPGPPRARQGSTGSGIGAGERGAGTRTRARRSRGRVSRKATNSWRSRPWLLLALVGGLGGRLQPKPRLQQRQPPLGARELLLCRSGTGARILQRRLAGVESVRGLRRTLQSPPCACPSWPSADARLVRRHASDRWRPGLRGRAALEVTNDSPGDPVVAASGTSRRFRSEGRSRGRREQLFARRLDLLDATVCSWALGCRLSPFFFLISRAGRSCPRLRARPLRVSSPFF